MTSKLLLKHPYLPDLWKWFFESGRFSNIRHPYSKRHFDRVVMPGLLADSTCTDLKRRLYDSGAVPDTGELLREAPVLLQFLKTAAEQKARFDVTSSAGWVAPEDFEKIIRPFAAPHENLRKESNKLADEMFTAITILIRN